METLKLLLTVELLADCEVIDLNEELYREVPMKLYIEEL